jgi:hypothetical protein
MIHFNDSPRTFGSIDELIESGRNKGLEKDLLGDYTCWWKELTVRFDDQNKSASFVEVQGRDILVGPPSRTLTIHRGTIRQALTEADRINQEYRASGLTEDKYLDSIWPSF